jgi:hypothetical protein
MLFVEKLVQSCFGKLVTGNEQAVTAAEESKCA